MYRCTVALIPALVSWAVADALVAHHALIVNQFGMKKARYQQSYIANIYARNPCTVAMNAHYLVQETIHARQRAKKLADSDVLTAVARPTVQIPANRARKFVHGD